MQIIKYNTARLRQILTVRLSEEEVRTFCFDLEIDYDDLAGHGKAGKVRELISLLVRQEKIETLLHIGAELRPDIDWEREASRSAPLSAAPHGLRNHRHMIRWGIIGALVLGIIGGMGYYLLAIPISSDLDTAGSMIRSPLVLELGVRYTITMTGTWSTWEATWWSEVCRGEPEPLPQHATPGRDNGNVGLDPAYIFARPKRSDLCGQKETFPAPLQPNFRFLISLDNGISWSPLIPDEQVYNPQHQYKYTVIGQGKRAYFQLQEKSPQDNYGIINITIEE